MADDPTTQLFELRQQQVEGAADSFKGYLKKLLALLSDNPDFLLSGEIVGILQRRILLIQQVLNQDEMNLQRKLRNEQRT